MICWWHDIEMQQSKDHTHEAVVVTAHYLGSNFEGKEKKIIIDSIINHEFKLKPKFLEGKVLQDADKLDILTAERSTKIKEAVDAGLVDEAFYQQCINTAKEWLPQMPLLYNFDYSRRVHERRLRRTLRLYL
jgi:hypothetical protein